MIKTVVIKALRVCNLRCTYCYYINDETPEYGKVISEVTVKHLYQSYSRYLREGDTTGELIWHGGEPLMLGRERLQHFLDMQREYFPPGALRNLLQTNGLLVNDEWIEFFLKNNINVGVSLDGTKEAHDRFRVTKSGKGSYDLVIRAIQRLRKRGIDVCVIGVVGATDDGAGVVQHLRDELDVPGMDFLLPKTNHGMKRLHPQDTESITRFVRSAFREWVSGPREFNVRVFEALMKNALGVRHNYFETGAAAMEDVVVLETDGSFCMDPDFSLIDRFDLGDEYASGFSVHEPTFRFVNLERALSERMSEQGLDELSNDCQRCRMRSVCRGGHPASRYDDIDGTFDHPSAHCDTLYQVSEDVVDYLVDQGYAEALVDRDLKADLVLV